MNRYICSVTLWCATAAVPAIAQEPDEAGSRPVAAQLQQQIDEMRARGVPDDDPKLRNLLRFQESLNRGAARNRRSQEPPVDLDRIKQFVTEHHLESLFKTLPDGAQATPEQYERNLTRHRRQLAEMMGAFERGHGQRGEKMLESVKLELEIAKLAHRYMQAPAASESRITLRQEIDGVLRKQVRVDLEVREMKLQELADRLERQKAELRKDRERVDELVARKLDRHVTRAERRATREPGREGPVGDEDEE